MPYNDVIPDFIIREMMESPEFKAHQAEREKTKLPIPRYYIDEEFLCDVPVKFQWATHEDLLKSGTMSSVDHPSFAALRNRLEALGFIKTSRVSVNGDIALKSFTLNDVFFGYNDRFPSACAIKHTLKK